MKVEGPGRTQAASKSDKKGKVSDGGSGFGDMIASGPAGASSARATQSIAQLDSLLALQGADDPAQSSARKRMRQRGNVILGELDKVRLGMLSGTLTVGHMVDIADVVSSHREKITDPVLTAIMDEIDLRAQVELAKLRMAVDSKTN